MNFNIKKAREMMKTKGIECMIATSRGNVFYSSGSNIGQPLRLAPVFIPLNSEPVFGVHPHEEISARESTWIKDVRVYKGGEWLPLEIWDFIADTIKEKKLEKAKIGLELLDVPGLSLDYIRKLLPKADFVDVGPLFDKMRSVKSPEELKLLSEINLITAKVITIAFELAKPGDTEKKIARNMMNLILEYDADSNRFINLAAGEHTLEPHHIPGDYKVKQGDMIHVDFGAVWKGYGSDISRMAVVGEPTDAQLKAHRCIVQAELDTAEAMKAGATVMDVHNAVARSYEKSGYKYPRLFIGHSTGIGGHEFPMLGPFHGDWVLEPDMFFQLEPSLTVGKFRVHHEDSFVTGKSGGAKIVSEYRNVRELQVIR